MKEKKLTECIWIQKNYVFYEKTTDENGNDIYHPVIKEKDPRIKTPYDTIRSFCESCSFERDTYEKELSFWGQAQKEHQYKQSCCRKCIACQEVPELRTNSVPCRKDKCAYCLHWWSPQAPDCLALDICPQIKDRWPNNID